MTIVNRLDWNYQKVLGSLSTCTHNRVWTWKPLWNTLLPNLFKQIVSRSCLLPGVGCLGLQTPRGVRPSQDFFSMWKSGILSNFWFHNNWHLLVNNLPITVSKWWTMHFRTNAKPIDPWRSNVIVYAYLVKSVQNIWFSHRKQILGWSETVMILRIWRGPSWERMAPGH